MEVNGIENSLGVESIKIDFITYRFFVSYRIRLSIKIELHKQNIIIVSSHYSHYISFRNLISQFHLFLSL